jgi:low temperature requirement protein LtrA
MAEDFNLKTLNQRYEVTPLELFFDLVFAFAVSQLSHHLLTHVSWRGAAETLVMLLAVLTVWSYTSWAATMIRVDQLRTRWMVMAVMFLSLFMNASVTRAFTTSGWAFVIPLLLIQLGRTVWTIVNLTDTVHREHYLRVLLWFSATTPLWIAGSAVNPAARVLWWLPAAGVELLGTLLAHPIPGRRLRSANVEFDADHMLERCRLFLLIALGETVLTIGAAIAEAPLTLMTVATGAVALAGTVALWALAFGRSHRLVLRHIEKTCDPVHASRHAVNVTIVMVAGLIAVAVANEKTIMYPYEHDSLALSLLLCGGPILFLAAQGCYLWAILNVWPALHLSGGVALLLMGVMTLATPAYTALTLVGASLTVLAIIDRCYEGMSSDFFQIRSNITTGRA